MYPSLSLVTVPNLEKVRVQSSTRVASMLQTSFNVKPPIGAPFILGKNACNCVADNPDKEDD